MAFYELRCQKCGGELHKLGDVFKCDYCKTTYLDDHVEKEKEVLRAILDEAKQEKLANLRHVLWEEIHAEYIDSEKIVDFCRSVRKLKPDDFEARFFEVANAGNGRDVNDFIDNINVNDAEHNCWTEEVINFMIKSLRAENLLSLTDLIERAYKNVDLQKYNKYATMVSEEAKKVEGGIYEPGLPRDVFVMYSSKDFKKVKELVYTLEESGLKCFVALRNLQHGKGAVANYQRALETAMDNCKVIVFLSSKNSRSLDCDAVRVEMPYLKRRDIENAPYEFRQHYEKMPSKYKKPRVEYRLDNEKSGAAALVREFFGELEYAYSADEVLNRVVQCLTAGIEEKPQEKICIDCGAKNPIKTKFCMECGGREFAANQAEYEKAKHDKDKAAIEAAEKRNQELLEKLKAMEEANRKKEEEQKKESETERLNRELLERLKRLEDAQNNAAVEMATTKDSASDKYDLKVVDYSMDKLSAIKKVREIVGVGLADALKIVEGNNFLKEEVDKNEADEIEKKLLSFGIKIRKLNKGVSQNVQMEESTYFAVRVENAGSRKLDLIKLIKEEAGLGLKDAKDRTEDGLAFKKGLTSDEADEIIALAAKTSAVVVKVPDTRPQEEILDDRKLERRRKSEAESLRKKKEAEEAAQKAAKKAAAEQKKKEEKAAERETPKPVAQTAVKTEVKKAEYFTVNVSAIGPNKLNLIKWIKKETGFGLVDAKARAEDGLPFMKALTSDEADEIIKKGEALSAVIEKKPDSRSEKEILADREREEKRKAEIEAERKRQEAEEAAKKKEQEEKERREREEKERKEREERLAAEREAKKKAEEEAKRKELQNIRNRISKTLRREGDYVWFGSYQQSEVSGTPQNVGPRGKDGYSTDASGQKYWSIGYRYFKVEPIKWRILKEEDGVALLFAENVLEQMRFDKESNKYENSEVRKWLNETFYSVAFDLAEQVRILPTQINCQTSKLNDKVFLLSKEELTSPEYGFQEHEGWDSARAKKNSDVMSMYDKTGLSWWTRSADSSMVVGVHFNGDMATIREVNPPTSGYFSYYMGVVPAIRIVLKESECKNGLKKEENPPVNKSVAPNVEPAVKKTTATSTVSAPQKKSTLTSTASSKPTSTHTASNNNAKSSSSKNIATSATPRYSVNSFSTLQKQFQKQKEYRASGRCQHCGGTFKGLFTKTCSSCGKKKDY